MTLENSRGLAVSLPSSELASIRAESSVCEVSDILASPVSPALHSAITLIMEFAETAGVPGKCVVRPELFTDGKSLEWLREKLTGFTDHIHLSDGHTIKTLPGFRTHLFLYCRSRLESHLRLEALIARAPEIVVGLASQINSHLGFQVNGESLRPPPLLVRRCASDVRKSTSLWGFYGNIHSIEDSVGQIVKRGRAHVGRIKDFESLRFFPVSTFALQDSQFSRLLLKFIVDAFFHPSSLLLIQLEEASDEQQQLHRGLACIFEALRLLGASLPRSAIANIILVTGEIGETHPLFSTRGFDVVMHQSIEFWRYTQSFFDRAESVTIANGPTNIPSGLSANPPSAIEYNFLPSTYAEVFGRQVNTTAPAQ